MASSDPILPEPYAQRGLLSHEGYLKKLAHTGRSRPWPFVIIHLPILLKERGNKIGSARILQVKWRGSNEGDVTSMVLLTWGRYLN